MAVPAGLCQTAVGSSAIAVKRAAHADGARADDVGARRDRRRSASRIESDEARGARARARSARLTGPPASCRPWQSSCRRRVGSRGEVREVAGDRHVDVGHAHRGVAADLALVAVGVGLARRARDSRRAPPGSRRASPPMPARAEDAPPSRRRRIRSAPSRERRRPVGPADGATVRYCCLSCVSPRDGSTMNTIAAAKQRRAADADAGVGDGRVGRRRVALAVDVAARGLGRIGGDRLGVQLALGDAEAGADGARRRGARRRGSSRTWRSSPSARCPWACVSGDRRDRRMLLGQLVHGELDVCAARRAPTSTVALAVSKPARDRCTLWTPGVTGIVSGVGAAHQAVDLARSPRRWPRRR